MFLKSLTHKQKQLTILLKKEDPNTDQNTSNISLTCY